MGWLARCNTTTKKTGVKWEQSHVSSDECGTGGPILDPFSFHTFLINLTVEETHRKGKYPLYVHLLLRPFRVGNACAIEDIYGQQSLRHFDGFRWPLTHLPPCLYKKDIKNFCYHHLNPSPSIKLSIPLSKTMISGTMNCKVQL
uniref:Uncharacterized protein n=1 Tax=Papilio polytes TaxID=76194 RepID=I4DSC1_PAPPL|nr:unknown unsecreted protein [Papilio polytes]